MVYKQNIPKYNSKGELVKSPIIIEDKNKFYTGTIYNTNDGYTQVQYYKDANHVGIKYLDDGTEKECKLERLQKGTVTKYVVNEIDTDFINKYVGKVCYNNAGCPYRILQYYTANSILIEFLDTGIRRIVKKDHIFDGGIHNRESYGINRFEKELLSLKEGDIRTNYDGDKYQIIHFYPDGKVCIKFLKNFIKYDDTYADVSVNQVVNNHIMNPYSYNEYGGIRGTYQAPTQEETKRIYKIWRGMLSRTNNSKCASYDDVEVAEEWYNFDNFGHWYYTNWSVLNKSFSYQIDKDFKQFGEPEKFYSPSTCMLIPVGLNLSIKGIYQNKLDANGNTLPIGVIQDDDGSYYCLTNQSDFSYDSIIKDVRFASILYRSNNPNEVFDKFKEYKTRIILSLATYYNEQNALNWYDYDWFMNKFEIKKVN